MSPLQERYIKGKTISHLGTQKIRPRDDSPNVVTTLDRIHFTDGSSILLSSNESDDHPYVTARYKKP